MKKEEAQARVREDREAVEKAERERREGELVRLAERERMDVEEREVDRLRGWAVGGRKAGRRLDSVAPRVLQSAVSGEEEAVRGLGEEARVRLERERRARAAEERIRKMQGK